MDRIFDLVGDGMGANVQDISVIAEGKICIKSTGHPADRGRIYDEYGIVIRIPFLFVNFLLWMKAKRFAEWELEFG